MSNIDLHAIIKQYTNIKVFCRPINYLINEKYKNLKTLKSLLVQYNGLMHNEH